VHFAPELSKLQYVGYLYFNPRFFKYGVV